MHARQTATPHDMPTRTPDMNHDLRNFIASVITQAVLPTLLVVATVAFITMPYTLGHHPGEAATAPPVAAKHMT